MRERKSPSDVKLEKAEAVKLEVIAMKRVARDKAVVRNTFATDDGRRCLKILMDKCCYQAPVSHRCADGILHSENLQHNAALQGLYLWIRKHIDKDTLIAVEVEGLQDSLKGSEK